MDRGRISAEQLDAALAMQRQFGGRLGTNLIELGVLRVDEVAQELARQLGVRAALKEHFVRADRRLFQQFPRRLAEIHSVVPLGAIPGRPKALYLAMMDPLNLQALDEISLVLSCQVEALVAPEARIQYVLEKLWGIKPNRRTFIRMDFDPTQLQQAYARMQRRAAAETSTPEAELSPPAKRPADTTVARPRRAPIPTHLEPPPFPSEAEAPAATSPAPQQHVGHRPHHGAVLMQAPANLLPKQRAMPHDALQQALRAIAAAAQRDEAAAALVEYLAQVFSCGILLLIRDQLALGWRGHATSVDPATIEALLLPLSAPSVFASVYETGKPFRGALPASGEVLHDRFYMLLRCAPPREILVVPVLLGHRVVQLVYAHGGPGQELHDDAEHDLLELTTAVAAAYRRVIRRQRGD